jgi:hypothetical protein
MPFATATSIANDTFFDNEFSNKIGNVNNPQLRGTVSRNFEVINETIIDQQTKFTSRLLERMDSFIEFGKERIKEVSPVNLVRQTGERVKRGASRLISENPFSEVIGNLNVLFGGGSKFEVLHNDLVEAISQVQLTERALEANRDQLEKLSEEGDISARNLLEHIGDLERSDLYEKILDRQKINSDEASQIIDSLKLVANNIGDVEKNLIVGVPQILGGFQEILSDQRVSEDFRRDMLSDVQGYVQELGLSGEKVDQFLDINLDNFKLNQENLAFVEDVFKEIEDDDIENAKLRFSLEEISNKLDKSVLERGELTDLLAREEEEGETFEQKFLQNASLISAGKQISGGFGSALLGAVGLGALNVFGVGDILGEFVGGKIGGTLTKMLPKVTSALGLKGLGIGGAIGKIAPVLFLAKSLFDFGKGFLNAADISGIAEENLKFMDKVKAGISSFISGITFGLFIDPKETYEALFKTSLEDLENMLDLFWEDFTSIFSMDIEEIGTIVKDIARDLFDKNPLIWLLDEGAQLIGFDEGVVSGKIRELAKKAFESVMSPMEALWDAGKALFDETDERSFWDKAWGVAKGVFNIHPLNMLLDFATDLLGIDTEAITNKVKGIAEEIFDYPIMDNILGYGKDMLGFGEDEADKKIEDVAKSEGGIVDSFKGAVGKTFDFFFGDEEGVEGEVRNIKREETVGRLTSQPVRVENIEKINRDKRIEKQRMLQEERQRDKNQTLVLPPSKGNESSTTPLPSRVSLSNFDISLVNSFLYQ